MKNFVRISTIEEVHKNGTHLKSSKTKTLIVKDLEGLRVVPPGLEPGTK